MTKKKDILEIRESLVPKIKELYPNIVVADNDLTYEALENKTIKELYFEDPEDYTEIKKIIGSTKLGYPTVLVRLKDLSLNAKLIDFLADCRYVFVNKDYTLVLAQKGYATPVFHIKEKFHISKILNVKG
jgi:hypothetical protein